MEWATDSMRDPAKDEVRGRDRLKQRAWALLGKVIWRKPVVTTWVGFSSLPVMGNPMCEEGHIRGIGPLFFLKSRWPPRLTPMKKGALGGAAFFGDLSICLSMLLHQRLSFKV